MNSYYVSSTIIPILQMKIIRNGEVNYLLKIQMSIGSSNEWVSRTETQICQIPDSVLLVIIQPLAWKHILKAQSVCMPTNQNRNLYK